MKDHKENGSNVERVLPKIAIAWDDEKKVPIVTWDQPFFSNFEFILAIMESARLAVDNVRRMALTNQMQQAQMQAQIEAAVRQKLIKG